jgi:hypothetical protein
MYGQRKMSVHSVGFAPPIPAIDSRVQQMAGFDPLQTDSLTGKSRRLGHRGLLIPGLERSRIGEAIG